MVSLVKQVMFVHLEGGAGTPATRPERYHWKSDWGDRVWGDEYESIWRERKK